MSDLLAKQTTDKLPYRVGEIVFFDECNIGSDGIKQGVILSSQCQGKDEYIVALAGSDEQNKHTVTIHSKDLANGSLDEKLVIRVDKFATLQGKTFKKCNQACILDNAAIDRLLRAWSAFMATNYYEVIHKPLQNKKFVASSSRVPYAGRVFDEKEMISLIDSSLDFWLTAGRYCQEFEKEFAHKIGVKFCHLVNSGSSANLLALMALTSPKFGQRRIYKGDEVITLAAGFPTTVNPILQLGAVPVFVDVTLPTYNIDVAQLEAALSDRSKAVMIAHTLGNPFDIKTVADFCRKHELWLIEDNCDALGSKYAGKFTGSFGDVATSSFYPPHHITMGEGGAVYTSDSLIKIAVASFRDWGRDCQCNPGQDDLCRKRFQQQFGTLPKGYDHKYIYSHLGYNLKVTDMQAAIGCEQLKKLDGFIEARKRNFRYLYDGLKSMEDFFVLPEATADSEPSWFGFLLTLRKDCPCNRDAIVQHLESNNIQTRMLFAGNYTKHPVFDEMRKNNEGYRIIGDLKTTNRIMNDTFWVGVYPGMTEAMMEYIIEKIRNFVKH